MLQILFFLVSLTKKSLPEYHPIFTPSHRRQRKPDLPINDINFITTMASNALDDGQMNTLILSAAYSDPTTPTDL